MPADRDLDMAFVLVQHLAPDHKSLLSEIIRRFTRMQVFEVEDGMVVKSNCVYIIPPDCNMAVTLGTLHLLHPMVPRGHRLPIDYFFESLAADRHENAIGIVLSGTGSDGTLGVRAIKDAGGMVIAQSTSSSEFDGMPRSAIATGLVDYQLPPSEMPEQLMAYAGHTSGQTSVLSGQPTLNSERALTRMLLLLRTQTGHDFSHYKVSTIFRRIERRMAVHGLDAIDSYVKYLHQTPPEVDALFQDLLIGVTAFFRNPEAFRMLGEKVIPKLFAGKTPGSSVRIWCAGCSTGEEAYSLAMLLVESMDAIKQRYNLQVFATDIDSRAIASARAGLFPASIAADLNSERLARFFTMEPNGQNYRVNKALRNLLVFSEQDLIKDPPFSKLDLVSCRNLLIYLDPYLQKKLIPLFHYALNPNGMLLLGSAEGIGQFENLFAVVDRKDRLFQRKEDLLGRPRTTLRSLIAPVAEVDASRPIRAAYKETFSAKLPLRSLMEQTLLRHIAPASALVSADGDIVYLHGRTGM